MPTTDRPQRRDRALLAGTALFAAGLGGGLTLWRSLLDESARQTFEGHLLYWWMPLLLLVAGVVGALAMRGVSVRRTTPVVLAALSTTIAVALAVSPTFRMQWDETNLLSTSKGMYELRGAFMTTDALLNNGEVAPLHLMVDKRPPLFPFLVSLLHDVSGYSIEHPFALNLAALFALLTVVGTAVTRRIGRLLGLAAIALVVNSPIVVACARSGGFELFAAMLLAVTICAARSYVENQDLRQLGWLLTAGLLFSYSRYESGPVFAALLLPTLWLTRRHWLRDDRALAMLVVFPALLTPLAFLFVHSSDRDFYSESTDGTELIAVAHAVEHLPGWLWANFDVTRKAAFAGPWTWLALVAVVAAAWRRRLGAPFVLMTLPVTAATGAALVWFYGSAEEPTALRLYVPAAIMFSLGVLLLPQLRVRRFALALLVAATAMGALRLHLVADGNACPVPLSARRANATADVLPQLEPFRRECVLISTAAQFLCTRGYAALRPRFLQRDARELEAAKERGDIKHVFVLVTPKDADATVRERHGDVTAIVQNMPVTEFAFVDDEVPLMVYRLR